MAVGHGTRSPFHTPKHRPPKRTSVPFCSCSLVNGGLPVPGPTAIDDTSRKGPTVQSCRYSVCCKIESVSKLVILIDTRPVETASENAQQGSGLSDLLAFNFNMCFPLCFLEPSAIITPSTCHLSPHLSRELSRLIAEALFCHSSTHRPNQSVQPVLLASSAKSRHSLPSFEKQGGNSCWW